MKFLNPSKLTNQTFPTYFWDLVTYYSTSSCKLEEFNNNIIRNWINPHRDNEFI